MFKNQSDKVELNADISLITSSYKSEDFLPSYSKHVFEVASQLKCAGLSLEVIVVINDASEKEAALLTDLCCSLQQIENVDMKLLHVERESIYASWNRGVRESTGKAIGIWAVDDIRYAEALMEGHELIASGCEIVDFPYRVRKLFKWLGITLGETHFEQSVGYFKSELISPFFMFSREFYEKNKPFDEGFRINGDLEWVMRQTVLDAHTDYGKHFAGLFYHHGGNLSAMRKAMSVEQNIVHLRRGAWNELRLANPKLMQDAWMTWGDNGCQLPEEIQDQLWGEGSSDRWKQYLRQEKLEIYFRSPIRYLIDLLRMRHLLASIGLVKSSKD